MSANTKKVRSRPYDLHHEYRMADSEDPHQQRMERTNEAEAYLHDRGKRHVALKVCILLVVLATLAGAGFIAWYFTQRSNNYLETFEVIGKLGVNIYTRAGTVYTKGENDAQQIVFGNTTAGLLTFSSYCSADTVRPLLKDQRLRFLCVLFSAEKAATVDESYRLLVQTTSIDDKEDFDCYEIRWDIPAKHAIKDCFYAKDNHAYGGGQRHSQKWPSNFQPVNSKNVVSDPFSRDGFSDVVIPYWVFTTGISIMADSRNNIVVDLNNSNIQQNGFCIGTNPKELKFVDESTQMLKYFVCVGKDVTHVHRNSLKKYQDAAGTPFDDETIRKPIWTTLAYGIDEEHNLDQQAVQYLADTLQQYELPVSQILIDHRWENQPGEDIFNAIHFADPESLFSTLRSRKMSPMLMMHPFVAFNSTVFDSITRRLLARDFSQTPLSATWWSGEAAMLDFTEPGAVIWKEVRAKNLLQTYQLGGCRFLGGSSGWISSCCNRTNSKYWRQFHAAFAKGARKICGDSVQLEVADKFSRRILRIADLYWIPTMSTSDNLADQLLSLIPTALTVSLLGHPLFIPPMVGGNPFINNKGVLDFQTAESRYATGEMYLRWLGVVLFMPILEFSVPPWFYQDDSKHVLDMTKTLLRLRYKYTEYLVQVARQSAGTGEPMIRPLWWSFSKDRTAWTCGDQYFVGDDLMVAPIISLASVRRKVYLPVGTWVSAQEMVETGPKWLDVAVGLDEVPVYFRKKSV